jgi:hypothetical protein
MQEFMKAEYREIMLIVGGNESVAMRRMMELWQFHNPLLNIGKILVIRIGF